MSRGEFTAQTRVQVLLDDIKDGYLELEDIAEVRRAKLEQCRNLRQFEIDAEQVDALAFVAFLHVSMAVDATLCV